VISLVDSGRSLILSYPSLDDCGLFGSCVFDGLRIVLIVGFPKVEVVSGLCDIDDVDIIIVLDLLRQTTCCPRIQLAVRENDVGDCQEIVLNI